jgi:hypothetical protein
MHLKALSLSRQKRFNLIQTTHQLIKNVFHITPLSHLCFK